MAHPVTQLLDRLSATLTALREALSPSETPAARSPRKRRAARGTSTKTAAAGESAAALKARRKAKTPSKRLALQGKYMAAVRGLSSSDKTKVRKVLAEQGVEAAITLALSKKA